jgi:hypothetical protein
MAFQKSPQWKTKNLQTHACWGTLSIPPNMVKWANVRSKQLLEIKGIKRIYSKVSMIKSDTYHDTWTNYLMEQEPFLIQDQVDGAVAADKTKTMEEEKVGPPGP